MTGSGKWAGVLPRAAVAVGLALLTAGCSPPEHPLVAVGRAPDGDIRALLRPCSDEDAFGEVSLLRDEDKGGRATSTDLGAWTARPPGSVTGEQEFSLFRPPPDWAGKARPATGLASGPHYYLSFDVEKSNGAVQYEAITSFTSATLAKLKPGQWWVAGEAMSRAEFRKQADDAC
ncbi:hypothetical protein AB0L33_30645 [Streptomyces sp. NPDC052299]|uniref:hypothetical protein n=1 Tax=Streptomyces sp. NPDC052299 TaxID=3155054 RepID=UPI003444F7D4